ncbi:TetR/AcrR family transcriptional regulator [Paraburkholderia dinghuensis]|uniref:TetR/AcrR family transcriptional regulator n=1 Tax=Paraburkholderia dinghuensis TaxID=2305225 RepID=A0A3N6PMI1_9BURK|nr:TetR/AcrR family transcriptional regulator [Paraburkholderia dinghuensis]RQH00226.1 TetR/AcrR family transcriptional regulator [Paraburkholderia dinghuensis]
MVQRPVTTTRSPASESERARPRPRGRRRADAELDVRERLLACATQLFAEHGIAATTMAQIATAAGVTSAMVHYYFTNREKLLDAVVDERIARSIEYVWSSVESEGSQDPDALVEGLIARLFDVTARMPWLPPLWLREIVNEGGLLRERMFRRLPFGQLQRFAARIGEAQLNGTVNPALEAPLLFMSIIALIMLPLATAPTWQSASGLPKIDRDVLHRHVSALLSAALRVPPGKTKAPTRRKPRSAT